MNTLFNAMARGDKFLFEVAQKTILSGTHNDLETIQYRQKILQDCLNNPDVLRELYALACEAMEKQKKPIISLSLTIPFIYCTDR